MKKKAATPVKASWTAMDGRARERGPRAPRLHDVDALHGVRLAHLEQPRHRLDGARDVLDRIAEPAALHVDLVGGVGQSLGPRDGGGRRARSSWNTSKEITAPSTSALASGRGTLPTRQPAHGGAQQEKQHQRERERRQQRARDAERRRRRDQCENRERLQSAPLPRRSWGLDVSSSGCRAALLRARKAAESATRYFGVAHADFDSA